MEAQESAPAPGLVEISKESKEENVKESCQPDHTDNGEQPDMNGAALSENGSHADGQAKSSNETAPVDAPKDGQSENAGEDMNVDENKETSEPVLEAESESTAESMEVDEKNEDKSPTVFKTKAAMKDISETDESTVNVKESEKSAEGSKDAFDSILAEEDSKEEEKKEEPKDAFDSMLDNSKQTKEDEKKGKDPFDSMLSGEEAKEEEKPKDAFDSMLTGEDSKEDEKPKDAFDSMLTEKSTDLSESKNDSCFDNTELSIPADPEPEKEAKPVEQVAVSSSEEEVETDVETEEEVEEQVPFVQYLSMVSHIVAAPEELEMVKKKVSKKVKRLVKRKKMIRKTRFGASRQVVTVEDDGKPLNQWESNIINDDEYFESLSSEDLEWFQENGPKVETAGNSGLKCTSCCKQVTMLLGSHTGMFRHPILGVGICKKCRTYYKDGSGWDKDDEGLDVYCRWCAEGGEILICDHCPKAFCKRCIQRNLGRQKVTAITSADEWSCFGCDPKQLLEKRAEYYAVWKRFKSGNFKDPAELRKELREAQEKKESDERKKMIDKMMRNPKNFVDENLAEAFKTLTVYQKCLEQERDRWFKGGQSLNLTTSTAICRALRKIYAITKQNMDLLDKAVVQSFVEHFPRESTRIHMGKVGVKVKDGALTGKPTKIVGSTKVKLKTPTKKSTPAPRSRKPTPKAKKGKTQEVVVLNGSPVYADPDDDDIFQVVRPSLSKKKPLGPASRRGKPLYTKKKATRYSSDDDSDVQIVGDSSDEDERPGPASRKRKRPSASPAPLSVKKRRPGPKSKTMR